MCTLIANAWGWVEREGGSDEFAQFDVGRVRLALYPLDLLGDEAAPGCSPPVSDWNGITLAINVASRTLVEEVFVAATASGARIIAAPIDREWGGYSAYVADPEGQRWEIAWAPGFDLEDWIRSGVVSLGVSAIEGVLGRPRAAT